MQLERLAVVHQRKCAESGADGEWRSPPAVLRFETCLRRIGISDVLTLPATASAGLPGNQPIERFRGTAAYEFLLGVATGLYSEIAGESEVFGQFRDAWRAHEQRDPLHARSLSPLVQKLFEDVKEIRARHLQNAGTITYGGLTRHLLGAAADAPALVIGAGNMAQSVAPYLAGRPLWFWNRTRQRAEQLREQVQAANPKCEAPIVLCSALENELEAWRTATNVVVCVPPDPRRDAQRIAAWSGNTHRQRLVHLGVIDPAGTPWQDAPGLATLRDLFALQTANNRSRSIQIERARAACREKARLRTLGGPASLAHGWEDLSVFATTA